MNLLIARQPIFDRTNKVYGYELLYREAGSNFYTGSNGDSATSSVITGTFLEMGIGTLTGGKKAFINFTDQLIKQQVATLLSRDYLVIELLESIEPTGDIIASCRKLKDQGYAIALDDFVFREEYMPLVELADIIKVDFLITTGAERRDVIRRFEKNKIKFLAEKIETHEDFELAMDLGYSYFQGYYFSKPVIISSKALLPSKINHLQLVKVLSSNEPEFKELAEIIERDAVFSYEVLKLVNSVLFYRGNRITSIRQALVRLGLEELKKWAYIAVLRKMGGNQNEAINYCAIRAKSMELLSQKLDLNKRRSEFFTLGILSMIDVLTGCTMEVILDEIPIGDEIKQILLNLRKEGAMAECYSMVLSYEKGEWAEAAAKAEAMGIKTMDIMEAYYTSIMWVDRFE